MSPEIPSPLVDGQQVIRKTAALRPCPGIGQLVGRDLMVFGEVIPYCPVCETQFRPPVSAPYERPPDDMVVPEHARFEQD